MHFHRAITVVASSFLAAMALGCGPARTEAKSVTSIQPANEFERMVSELVPVVSKLRKLEVREPIKVIALDDKEFGKACLEHLWRVEALVKEKKSKYDDTKIFFGFYDYLGTRAVVVRREKPEWWRSDPRETLAHEIVHALQDQHFDIRGMVTSAGGRDAVVGLSALMEGDANLVEYGVQTQISKKPVRRALLAYAAELLTDSDYLIALGLVSPQAKMLSPLQRRAQFFPYLEGAVFASRLYQAGGFSLINEAYRHPPSGTDHILHPERYLAGRRAATFEPLPVPPGAESLLQTTFGELGTEMFLSEMMRRFECGNLFDVAPVGWDGDRIDAYRDAAAVSTAVLRVKYESEEGAKQFESGWKQCIAKMEGTLVSDPTKGNDSHDSAIFDPKKGNDPLFYAPDKFRERKSKTKKREPVGLIVVRQGSFVTLVASDKYATATALVPVAIKLAPRAQPAGPRPTSLAQLPAPYVPLGSRPEFRGTLVGHEFINKGLALRADVTGAKEVKTSEPDLQLQITWPGAVASLFLLTDVTPQKLEETRKVTEEAFAKGMVEAGGTAKRSGSIERAEGKVPLGKTTEFRWPLEITGNAWEGTRKVQSRFVTIDDCGGDLTYALFTIAFDEEATALLDRWITSFRKEGESLFCRALAQEAIDPP